MDAGDQLVDAAKEARRKGMIEQAAIFYTHAAGHALQQGDLLACAHRYRHAAELNQQLGRNKEAAALFAEALSIYRADPATPVLDLANLLRPYALLKEKAGDRTVAVALWTEARTLYMAAGVEAGVTESERHLATLA